MKIGIFFHARRNQGGLFQYAATLVHCLHAHERAHKYVLFKATAEPLPFRIDRPGWEVVELAPRSLLPRRAMEGALLMAGRAGWRYPLRVLPQYPEIQAATLDLMLYVKPSIHSFLWPYPAVFPIHDLQHRFQPEFPEVSAWGECSRREFLYRNAVPRAAAILADSETGKEDVSRAYGTPRERVHALPHLAPTYLSPKVTDTHLDRVRSRYALPEPFLFYPAAFWPHKNHYRLIHALRIVKDRFGVRLPLVLVGGLRREYPKLLRLTRQLDLTDQVRFLGYVPDEDLYALYRLALALVMPTFFGPTNIPYLEAWSLDCPVVTSNVRGLPAQVGDAGLLIDPRDEYAMAEAIWRVHGDEDLRCRLIERGRQKIAQWTPRDFTQRLVAILDSCLI